MRFLKKINYIIILSILIFITSCNNPQHTNLELVPRDSDIIISLDIPRLLENRTINFILERKGIKRILEREMQIYLEDLSLVVISQKLSGYLDLLASRITTITYKNQFKSNLKENINYKDNKIFISKNRNEFLFKDKRVISGVNNIKKIIDSIVSHDVIESVKRKNAIKIFKEIDNYPIRIFVNLNSLIYGYFKRYYSDKLDFKVSGFLGVSIDVTNDSLKFNILIISNTIPLNKIKNQLDSSLVGLKRILSRLALFDQKLKIELDNIIKSIESKIDGNSLNIKIDLSHRFLVNKY